LADRDNDTAKTHEDRMTIKRVVTVVTSGTPVSFEAKSRKPRSTSYARE